MKLHGACCTGNSLPLLPGSLLGAAPLALHQHLSSLHRGEKDNQAASRQRLNANAGNGEQGRGDDGEPGSGRCEVIV
jgi:hypothetical protein